MCAHVRARPIRGRGKLVVPKTDVRVGFARSRVPRAPAPRVEAAEAARSRDFRDLHVLVSGVGRRSDTNFSPLAPARDYFARARPQTSPMGRFFARISSALPGHFLGTLSGSTLCVRKCRNILT